MEVSATVTQLNAGFTRSNESAEETEEGLNAFGIGAANRPEIELSPQARILQQTEQNYLARQEAIDQAREERRQEQENDANENGAESFLPDTDTKGGLQRQNTYAERATELYRSIENLL